MVKFFGNFSKKYEIFYFFKLSLLLMVYLDNVTHREEEFLQKLKQTAAKYYDIRKEIEHILIIAHTDADGYASAAILQRMAARDNISCTIKYYNRVGTWKNYINDILIDFDNYENLAIIFCDLGSEIMEISSIFKENNDRANIFILDHHNMEEFDEKKIVENINLLNPTIYGYDGLKEIAGATLCYMFAKEINLKNVNNAWIALIGISNDTLMNVKNYRSFNKMVLDDAENENEGYIEIKEGIMVYGATHESIANALAHSLLPFIKDLEGNPRNAEYILDKLGISSNKKVTELSAEEIDKIDLKFPNINLKGQYIIFPKKKSILKYAFEHGLIISNSVYKYPTKAENLIPSPTAPAVLISEYNQFIRNLTKNLALFVKTPKEYTDHTIFVDAGKRIPSNNWSDVASYSSVNDLYDSKKMLFMGGLDGNIVRLSVRCTEKFPGLDNGIGVDEVVRKIQKIYGGSGGGHKLAGGYKLAPNKYKKLKNNIDDIFS